MNNTYSVPRRVAERALYGLWREKQSLLFGGALVAAMIGYLVIFAPTLSTSAASSSDCADTVMAAVLANGAPVVQQQLQQCTAPEFQQRIGEQEFASRFELAAGTPVSKISRLGSYNSTTGAELVYYAVDAGEQSVGFVVYLDNDGKVTSIA